MARAKSPDLVFAPRPTAWYLDRILAIWVLTVEALINSASAASCLDSARSQAIITSTSRTERRGLRRGIARMVGGANWVWCPVAWRLKWWWTTGRSVCVVIVDSVLKCGCMCNPRDRRNECASMCKLRPVIFADVIGYKCAATPKT